MFAGHLGAGLGLGALAPRRNPGLVVLAAFALDVVLWVLVLAGVERVLVPVDYDRHHYLTFFFPYSHGLAATLLWALAFFLAFGRGRWGRLVAAAVASHFVLDWLVHVPEMPLFRPDSPGLGLGLWNRMPLALALVVLFVVGMTVAGQTVASAPPSSTAAALAALGGIAATVGLVAWIARPG